jgi:hypothetical protein
VFLSGDEGAPIQVDGEAWIQPPGMIRIIHKNRMKMLCRNKVSSLLLAADFIYQAVLDHSVFFFPPRF